MVISSILEAGMMLCWGSSWPFQVAKTYKTKDVSGKSILFLWLIETGYVLGLLYKTFFHFDYVIGLYLLNFTFVGADIVLYYRYKNNSKLPVKIASNPHKNIKNESKELCKL